MSLGPLRALGLASLAPLGLVPSLLLPPVLPPLAPLLVEAMGIPLPLVLTSGEVAPAVAVLLRLYLRDPEPRKSRSLRWVTACASSLYSSWPIKPVMRAEISATRRHWAGVRPAWGHATEGAE